jgi:3-methyladenine DNA glycosylase AlkD
MQEILRELRAELAAGANEAGRLSFARFFKEEILCYGLKNAQVRALGRKYWPQIKAHRKPEIYALFEALLASGYAEETLLVAEWAPKMQSQFARSDLRTFKRWIDKYLDNWAEVDSFCNHTMAEFLERFPDSLPEIMSWTRSANRWMKRAAAVSLIIPAKRGQYLPEALAIAEALLRDPDDMVQKGYGWLLKEASRLHQREVFAYVLSRRAVMPRTALRYAIELMPPELRAEAMKKEG